MTISQYQCLANLFPWAPNSCWLYLQSWGIPVVTKHIPRSRLYEQLGHRSGESIPALRQGRGCAAWLLFLRAVPARSSPSAIAFQHGSRLTGHLQAASPEGDASGQRGDAESGRRKPPIKALQTHAAPCMGRTHPPRAAGGTHWFSLLVLQFFRELLYHLQQACQSTCSWFGKEDGYTLILIR